VIIKYRPKRRRLSETLAEVARCNATNIAGI
jgi:hypothetical protein